MILCDVVAVRNCYMQANTHSKSLTKMTIQMLMRERSKCGIHHNMMPER